MMLTKGLTDYLARSQENDGNGFAGRGQVWLTVYCNMTGLSETLYSNQLATPESFEAFVTGFNQASPLFSIVDVGNGKEAADAKIKGDALLNDLDATPLRLTIFLQSVCVSSPDSLRLRQFSSAVWCIPTPRVPGADRILLIRFSRQQLCLYPTLSRKRGITREDHDPSRIQRPRTRAQEPESAHC